MMNFQLVSSLLRSAWFIHPDIAENYFHAVAMLLDGKPVDFEFSPFKVAFHHTDGRVTMQETNGHDVAFDGDQSEGAVMVMPVSGVLMKNDQACGPVGMQTMGEMIRYADNTPGIAGTVLKIDSPGGQADGVDELSHIIKGATKPVVAFVDGMAASAGFWISSAAKETIATPRSTVGSVGAMVSFADYQPALEQKGVKFHKIVSDQTPDKNAIIDKVRSGDYNEYREKFLNPLAQDFIDAVKGNRPGVTAEQTTGKTFFAQDVTGTMVDRIGTMADAIAAVQSHAAPLNSPKFSNQKINKPMTQLEQHLTTLQIERDDEGGVYLSSELQEQLNALIAPASTASTSSADEPAPAAAVEPPASTGSAAVELVAEPMPALEENPAFQRLLAEVEQLRDAAGAKPAAIAPKTDPGTQSKTVITDEKPENFWENVNKVKAAYL